MSISSSAMVTGSPHAARSAEIALGIRSARSLALVRRATAGADLADRDRAELLTIQRALQRAADAVVGEPSSVRIRGRRHIASMGLTLSTAVRDTNNRDRAETGAVLRQLAADIDTLLDNQPLDHPERLTSFLSALVRAADTSTAKGGETLVTAES